VGDRRARAERTKAIAYLNANGIDTSTVLSNGNLITNNAPPPPLLMNGSSTSASSSSSSVTSTALVAVSRNGSSSNGLQLQQHQQQQQQQQLVLRGNYSDIEDILPEWRQPYGRFENPYVSLLQSEKIEALESQGASRSVLMLEKLSLCTKPLHYLNV
jgi:hypothetical protein